MAASNVALHRPTVAVRLRLEAKHQGLALAAILLVALGLRMPYLSTSLWFDELWATHLKLDGLMTTLHTIEWDQHPPVYALFSFAWLRLFGDSEVSVRIPPLLFGLGTIGLAYVIAKRWAGPSTGLVAAFLMAVSPAHIWYSQEARPYSFDAFVAMLLIATYYRFHDVARGWLWLAVYAGVSLVAVQTHFFLLVFPGALTLLCLIKRCRYWRVVLAINCLAGLSVCAYLAFKYVRVPLVTAASHLRPFSPYELWLLFFQWFSTGSTLWSVNPYAGVGALWASPGIMAMQVALALVFTLGLYSLLRQPMYRLDVPILLFALPAALMVLSVLWSRLYIERSAIAVLPLFLIVLARGATAMGSRWMRLGMASTLVALGAAAVIGMYAQPDAWTVYKPKEDWRSVASYLDTSEPPLARLPIFSTSPAAPALELSYYRSWIQPNDPAPAAVAELHLLQPGQNPCDAPVSRRAGGLFLVHSGVIGNPDPLFKAALANLTLSGDCTLVEKQTFRAVEIFRFTLNAAR